MAKKIPTNGNSCGNTVFTWWVFYTLFKRFAVITIW